MGINFNTMERIAKFAESSGVKFCLKPPNLNNASFEGLKILEKDVFTRLNPFFTKMTEAENALLPKELQNTKMGKAFAEKIPKIRYRETEEASIFRDNGKLIAKSSDDKALHSEFKPTDIENVQALSWLQGVDTGVLHNHLVEGTLSGLDSNMFFGLHNKVMMATLPSGGYAALSRTKSLVNIDVSAEICKDISKFILNDAKAEIKLTRTNLTNSEIFKKIDTFRDEQLKRFVKKHEEYGLKYEYKHGDKSLGIIPDFKSVHQNVRSRFIEDGLTCEQADKALKEIDETPLENFYI